MNETRHQPTIARELTAALGGMALGPAHAGCIPSFNRRLPHNVEAEMALLGAILVDNRAFERVADFLLPGHFILREHELIFTACSRLIERGQTADPVTLKGEFENDSGLDMAGGASYLIRLADCAVTPITAGDYGRAVLDLFRRRELIALGEEIVNRAYDGHAGGAWQQIENAQSHLLALGIHGDGEPGFAVEDADSLDATPIPPRAWLLGTVLCRRYVTVIAAAGGMGKSSLAIAWALSLATGRPLTGDKVHMRSRVLIVTAEDDIDELRRRLRAARQHHGIGSIGEGRLGIVCLTGSGTKLVTVNDRGEITETGAAGQIAETIRQHRADAVIMDPLIKISGAPENDNSAVDQVMQIIGSIADRCNVSVLVLHHARKGVATPGDADAARGASSLIDAARVSLTLTGMSPAEAEALDVSEDDRVRLVRIDDAKVNITPRGTKARWYRLASVSLGNGTADYPQGDNVQAVERWTPPDAWEGLSGALLNRVLDDIDAGIDGEKFSSAPGAKARAAWRVVQKHAPEKSEAQCREIIRAWLKTTLLLVEEYKSPNRHGPAEGLVVDHSKRPS